MIRETSRPPVLVAPDSFKGTFSASEVAAGLARGLRLGGIAVVELPLADGGEGTMEVLLGALGGDLRKATVSDPLGRPVDAEYALLCDGRTAIVEMAEASGLRHVAEQQRNAWAASTRGTGELIVAAARAGASRIIVAVGGSATTDGGEAAVRILQEVGIDVDLEVVCDVRTAWEDAPRLYGPQKGADREMVRRLEERLDDLARHAPRDPRGLPYGGAAGGLAGGLWAFFNAHLVPGASYVLDAVGFDAHARVAAIVVSGEGCLDEQTLEGKVLAEVAKRCGRAGVPCHAVVGENALGPSRALTELGLRSVRQATTIAELEAAGQTLAGLI
jgi:glycerate 2-kinase